VRSVEEKGASLQRLVESRKSGRPVLRFEFDHPRGALGVANGNQSGWTSARESFWIDAKFTGSRSGLCTYHGRKLSLHPSQATG
jgi:hypothetical protein